MKPLTIKAITISLMIIVGLSCISYNIYNTQESIKVKQ